MSESVPRELGQYTVESELGRGGMGVVYLATQRGLDRPVALKVLNPVLASDPEFVARFSREATTLARLDSPHIIAVYDHGRVGDVLYLATQYVAGGDLSALLKRRGPLPRAQALELFDQLLRGLRDAHRAGVIHRDIKPANILVRADEVEPHIYLCDFGIAHAEGADQHTRTGMVAGSTAFLAPERSEGLPASVQSDLYSAACVLWVMLTGQNLYQGTEFQVATQHATAPTPQLTGTDATTQAINLALRACLAKDPALRPPSADELLRLLGTMRENGDEDYATRIRTVAPPPAPFPAIDATVPRTPPSGTATWVPAAPAPGAVVRGVPAFGAPAPGVPASGASVPGAPTYGLGTPGVPASGVSAPGAPAPGAPTYGVPAYGVPAPSAAGAPGPRPRVGLIVGIVAGVVAALVLTGFVVVRVLDRTGAAAAPTAATRAPAASATAQAAETAATAQAPATAAEVTYTCWDGTEVTGLGDCGTPSGELGLRYVFPSLADDLDSCVLDSPLIDLRPGTTSYRCEYPDGFILYRYWADGADARAHFEDHYAGKPVKSDLVLDGQVAGFTYRGRLTNDDYTSTAALLNSHFTVSAASPVGVSERNALFATVTFRAVADLAGHPATEEPGVASRR